MTIDELRQRFVAIKKTVDGPAAPDAAEAMARECRDIAQDLLSIPGRSAPGSPPGMGTGHLRESVVVTSATGGGGIGEASCGPTARYARIQEFGGTIVPHGHPYLHWVDDLGSAYVRSVTLPPRPYMRPARRIGVESGRFKRAALDAFRHDTGL